MRASLKPTSWQARASHWNPKPAPTARRWVRTSARECIGSQGEVAAACIRQLVSPEGGVRYAAVLAGSVAPLQPSGPLKPTAMDSDPSESMSSDMYGPLSECRMAPLRAPMWSTPASSRRAPKSDPNFFQVYVTPVPSWPGYGRPTLAVWRPNLRLRSWWLSRQPPTVSEPRSARCGPSMGGGCEFPHLHAPGGPLCVVSG